MAFRLPSQRVEVALEDGPTVELESIGSWPIYQTAVGLASTFLNSQNAADLTKLYDFFVAEAQPSWSIIDHRGAIPPTGAGMLRLPLTDIALPLIYEWAATFIPKSSAVDEVIPPGQVRDELNKSLRKKRHA